MNQARTLGRGWLIAAALALPVGLYFLARAVTSPGAVLSVAFALAPVLLALRAVWPRPIAWMLSGGLIGIAVAGLTGSGIVLLPFALVAIALEARDPRSRSFFAMLVTAGSALVTLALLISMAAVLYRQT